MDIKSKDILIAFSVVLFAYWWWKPSSQEVVVEKPPVQEVLRPRPIETPQVVEEPVKVAAQPVEKLPVPKTSKSPRAKYPNLDESFVPFDEAGNRYIMQVVKVGKHVVYHGDVLLGDVNDLPRLLKSKVIKKGQPRKWPRGVIPYVIDDSIQNYEIVMDAIGYLNLQTNMTLVEREDQENFVLITHGDQDCYSYAGMIGGKQEIFLNPKCGVREILHEFMHTIGFFHEQNREDRDQYIKVLWENIDEDNHPQFKKLPNDFIGLVGRPFDFESIMLYSSFTFSLSPQEPAMLTTSEELIPEVQSLLSEEDIKRVNLAYPKYQ